MDDVRGLTEREERAWRSLQFMQMRLEGELARQLVAESGLSYPDYLVLVALTDRPDGRIRPGAPLPAPSERQRQLHKALVGGLKIPDFLRVLVFQDAEDHLRNVASRASSSPESSPSTASKSLASRKLR